MFVDDLSTKDALLRMIRRTTANLALRDDLLQEALIHLWLTEMRRPGQTRSWYLQSCKFHVLHYLASGRSVDSAKRRNGQLHSEHDADGREMYVEHTDATNSVLDWVGARELIALLSPRLTSHERAVLVCLADGLGPREIGRRLGISHTMAIKHRRKIANLLARLETSAAVSPVNGAHRTPDRANGVPHTNGNGAAHLHDGNGRTNGGQRSNGNLLPTGILPANVSRLAFPSAATSREAGAA